MIIEVPASTPLTTPVDGSTVATAGVAEAQVPPEIDALNVDVPFEQTLVLPVIVAAVGTDATVIVAALVVAEAQAPLVTTAL